MPIHRVAPEHSITETETSVILTLSFGLTAGALAGIETLESDLSVRRFVSPTCRAFGRATSFVPMPSLGYVLVDILHLDHAELDVFMAKLQVRAGHPPPRFTERMFVLRSVVLLLFCCRGVRTCREQCSAACTYP